MSSDAIAVRAQHVSKSYRMYDHPTDRLKQLLWRGRRTYGREFAALTDVSFELRKGEVLGLVGRNGAGKSTLLQLICQTLRPTRGSVEVRGRVAALLELGAGFNMDFTGRENIYLNGSVLGLTHAEIDARFDEIVSFSGIADFIEQPVKTYSSGMFMRLAFSIATSVDPDILIIDEALSVGDGAFARKSFDRIMALKEGGATILFCSHSTYQVQALCSRAIWLEGGAMKMIGESAEVIEIYNRSLEMETATTRSAARFAKRSTTTDPLAENQTSPEPGVATPGFASIRSVEAACDGVLVHPGTVIDLHSNLSELRISVSFVSDPVLNTPTVAYVIQTAEGVTITSASTKNRAVIQRNATGGATVSLIFNRMPMMRGNYRLSIFLMCENAIHVYDHASDFLNLNIIQEGSEIGYFFLPHSWRNEN